MAEQAQATRSADEDAQSLTAAFGVFNELSERLTTAYAELEARVALLNRELADSRRQRQRERAQKEHLAAQLSVLLEALPAGVVVVDVRDRIDRFNPAAEQLFPGLAWGRRWAEVRAESLAAEVSPGEWCLSGERFITVLQRPLNDRGRILVLVDITDQRRLDQALERQRRLGAMGEMAAQLAHQIRTPLSTAVLYAGQLGKDSLQPTQRQAFADKLRDGLRHTEALVREMLAFSRGGGMRMDRVVLDGVIATAVAAVQPRLRRLAATLDIDRGDAEDYLLSGSSDALAGAIANLLENALDHAGEGARLGIIVRARADGWLHIVIEDDGPGIEDSLRDRIFDPFFTTRERGTGLGLAVVQTVVLEHGGRVSAGRSSLGGARFDLLLPAAVGDGEEQPLQGEA